MKEITALMLKERLDGDGAPLLIDVREPWEYEICHIAGSRSLPMRQVPDHCRELDTGRDIVVICHHGIRSAQVAAFLSQQGLENVMNLAGGIHAWAMDVDQSMAQY